VSFTLVATPGADDANSYQELAAFKLFLESYPWAPTKTDPQWNQLLAQAARLIDRFRYLGTPSFPGVQALAHPREYLPIADSDGTYYDPAAIAVPVVRAQAELAIWLGQSDADPIEPTGLEEFTEVKLGPLAVKMAEMPLAQLKPMIPPSIMMLLSPLMSSSSVPGFRRIVRTA
jgi:hypothetical protein